MGAERSIMDKLMCTIAILVFSFIEFWCSIALCIQRDEILSKDCEDEYAWAVGAGLISCVLAVVLILLNKFKPALLEGIVGMIMAGVMFAIWICCVAACTFDKPFAPGGLTAATTGITRDVNIAGNGYFATWLSLIFSGILLMQSIPQAAAAEKGAGALDFNKKMLAGIAFASLLEMWHAAKVCDDSAYKCEEMIAWGVAAGAIGLIVSLFWGLITKFVVSLDAHTKWVAILLTAFWIAAVVTLTMPNGEKTCNNKGNCGLFLSVSNGFVGTWVALCLSLVLTASCFGVDVAGTGGSDGGTATGHSHSHSTTTTTTTTTTETTAKSETGVEVNETRN